MKRPSVAALIAGVSMLLAAGTPSRAEAWDPSTTHLGMVDRAALRSGMHLQWMDQSDLTRGVFTGLRLDPKRLTDEERRLVSLAFRRAHAASGALGLGGPGACPGAAAPAATRVGCVEGDLWEMTALGWMRLGVLVELLPRARLLHHFVDLEEPTAATWSDRRMPRRALRSMYRRNGGALAETLSGKAFKGAAPSALARLSDGNDLWSVAATREHLRLAVLGSSRQDREHHLALGLIGVGALLHVVQDLSVPAHARGDITAFFAHLSDTPGDRGLPLQELARVAFGRGHLPEPLALSLRAPAEGAAAGDPIAAPRLADDLLGHLLGHGDWEGLIAYTGRRFFSETTLPMPRAIDPEASPRQAAAILLGEASHLDPVELEGARLAPWPAEAGYLVSSRGRMLAAFDTDERGRVRPYLDRRVLRSQANMLIPKAIEVSASVLGVLLPPFPPSSFDPDTGVLEIDLSDGPQDPIIITFLENAEGDRTMLRRLRLRPGESQRVRGVTSADEGGPEHRVVLALEGRTREGHPIVVERVVSGPAASPSPATTVPAPRPTPGPRKAQPPTQPTQPTQPIPDAVVPTRPPGSVPATESESEPESEPEPEPEPEG